MIDLRQRPLVRPRFLRWSGVVFVCLVPLVIHAAWDYAESWRLSSLVAEIRANGEPVTLYEIQSPRNIVGDAALADRYYRAAASLSGPPEPARDAERRANDEALRLLDLATPLPFAGFLPGTDHGLRTGELTGLAVAAGARTAAAIEAGDGRRASESLYAELRLGRLFDNILAIRAVVPRALMRLADVTRLADRDSLARLAVALEELDRDDLLRAQLLRERASILENGELRGRPVIANGVARLPSDVLAILTRPWYLQIFNRRLETLGSLIETASRPWPRRLEIGQLPYIDPDFREVDEFRFGAVAQVLALVRCARVGVASARYRLDRGARPSALASLVPAYLPAVPTDPFSGSPINWIANDGVELVYSVGPDRGDDRGRTLIDAAAAPGPRRAVARGDVGLRFTDR